MQKGEKPRILLTGGHLSPLLAVLDVLEKKADCFVVGRKYTFEADKGISLEYNLFKEKGTAPFYTLQAARLQRRFTKHTIPALLRFPGSILKTFSILHKVHPDVVLTFGGYIGLPVAVCARLSGIPVVLHEQTQHAGLTNKLIGKIAQKVCISSPSSRKYFPEGKLVLTGNPVRKEVFEAQNPIKVTSTLPILLIMGGSAGAHNINTFVEYVIGTLLENFTVIHQTGNAQEYKDYERLFLLRNKLQSPKKNRYVLKKFIHPTEIGWAYEHAEVVLSRSGANTVSELLALQKKALLIPLSHGQNNEQLENAKLYESSGLGEYVEEKNVQLNDLVKRLLTLKDKNVSEISKTGVQKNAANRIADVVVREAQR